MTRTPGHDRAGTPRVPLSQLPPILVTALLAALLGWALLFRQRAPGTTLGVLLGSVAVGVLLAVLLVRPPSDTARPVEPHGAGSPGPGRAGRPEPARSQPPEPDSPWSAPDTVGAQPQATQPQPGQLVLPVEQPVGQPAAGAPRTGQWWNRDAPAPAAAARAPAPVRPAPRDLGELRDSARVVQCPRCGAFRIDVQHSGTGYAFRCRADDHAWTWRPGTAWPATVLASRRRTAR